LINSTTPSSKEYNGKMGFSNYQSTDVKLNYKLTSKINPNPDPYDFKVTYKYRGRSGKFLVRVVYPNCTNYEGQKILIFKSKRSFDILYKTGKLDPHFYPGSGLIARFNPKQIKMAKEFVDLCKLPSGER
jgi:hypothetical protein